MVQAGGWVAHVGVNVSSDPNLGGFNMLPSYVGVIISSYKDLEEPMKHGAPVVYSVLYVK